MAYTLTFKCCLCGIGWVDRDVGSILYHLDKLSNDGCPLCGRYSRGTILLVDTDKDETDQEGH